MLRCKCCNGSFDLEDYTDPSEASHDICPECYYTGAYLENEEDELDDIDNIPEGRFENDALSALEDDPDLSQEELEDILAGPEDDEYDPDDDDLADFQDGDVDRDEF